MPNQRRRQAPPGSRRDRLVGLLSIHGESGYLRAEAPRWRAGEPALPPPGPALARHLTDHVRGLAGRLYGRRSCEIMRYWDEDRPEGDVGDHAFVAAWRA